MINHKFLAAPMALVLAVCASSVSAQLQPSLMTLITPIAGGEFGMALAVGDFDNDGRDDLAVGIRSADNQRGKVQIIKLSSPTEKQIWSQDSAGIAGVAEELDFFGFSLASGDFDGDGHDDLAIGAFGEAIEGNSLDAAGAVTVLYGSVDLLSSDGSQLWTQNSAGIQGVAEDGGEFGYALASGDFNGDGYDDLAVGAQGKSVGPQADDGTVNVIFGSASGLTSAGNQLWSQASFSCDECDLSWADRFGSSLASGEFNGDAYDDLAIGVPGERIDVGDGNVKAGAVHVLFGSGSGIVADGNVLLHQELDTIDESVQPEEDFGKSLAVGDFDGDGVDDLLIGVTDNDTYGIGNGFGAAHLITGLDEASFTNVTYHPIRFDDASGFGAAVAAGDFDNDGKADAAIGAPDAEDIYRMDGSNFTLIDEVLRAGAVSVYYSDLGDYRQIWHQRHPDNSEGIGGTVEAHDEVGAALVVGDWNGDGVDDLIIGAPGEDTTEFSLSEADSGTVGVLFGRTASIFQDRFE